MARIFQTYYIYNSLENGPKYVGFHIQCCCGDDTLMKININLKSSNLLNFSD